MTPEKRFLLAMSLSLLVLMFWSQMIMQRREKNKQKQQQNQQQNQNPNNNVANNDNNENKDKTKNKDNNENNNVNNANDNNNDVNNASDNNNDVNNPEENKNNNNVVENIEKITVDTNKYQMVWTNKGGALASMKLKKFVKSGTDKIKAGWEENSDDWLEITPSFEANNPSLLLFNKMMSGSEKSIGQGQNLSNKLWTITDKTKENPQQLIFELGPIDGIKYKKIYTFTEEDKIEGKLIFTNVSEDKKTCQPSLTASSGIAWECADLEVSRFITLHHFFRNKSNNAVSSYDYYDTALASDYQKKSNFSWIALSNKYFSSILELKTPSLVDGLSSTAFTLSPMYVEDLLAERRALGEKPDITQIKTIKMPVPVIDFVSLEIPAGESKEIEFNYYTGGKQELGEKYKDFTVLEDFGWFDVVARLLLTVMHFFHGVFHNFGVAIICLTICIKLILFPLTKKQQMSMQKYQKAMQAIQPQLKKLQEKYKNNRQQMNQEMMALYKKNNVNPIPIGGCLPIFVQIPIFIGLYNALLYSIVLRQETFLWVEDLARPDHFMLFSFQMPLLGEYLNLLPIIMTVLWILQQKLMPRPESPEMQQQQKIFMFMTIFFGYLFYSLPAGLVLYWLTINLISIIEQLIIRKFKTA